MLPEWYSKVCKVMHKGIIPLVVVSLHNLSLQTSLGDIVQFEYKPINEIIAQKQTSLEDFLTAEYKIEGYSIYLLEERYKLPSQIFSKNLEKEDKQYSLLEHFTKNFTEIINSNKKFLIKQGTFKLHHTFYHYSDLKSLLAYSTAVTEDNKIVHIVIDCLMEGDLASGFDLLPHYVVYLVENNSIANVAICESKDIKGKFDEEKFKSKIMTYLKGPILDLNEVPKNEEKPMMPIEIKETKLEIV